MQGEAEQLSSEMTLQIARSDLARRFERYLRRDSWQDPPALVDEVIHRLQERDAILVKYGTDNRGQDLFGFVHRSFQEYFAACWMADELDEAEFQEKLFANRDGWAETLYLAVAKQQTKLRRKTLLKLLAEGRAEFAVECLRATVKEDPWLQMLVQFLARHTWGGREHEGLRVAECANACAERPETLQVLKTMFEPAKREGQSLAAAVELAEELAARKVVGAQDLLHEFFKEAIGLAEDMITVAAGEFLYGEDARSLPLPSFSLDRFPVTNAEYERMVQGHKALRGQYSETDRQPVVNVNWFEAGLYARWRGCRLPSEQEWEKAAGWDAANHHKRVYPWGDEFDASRCNTAESDRGKTSPVGDYPLGRSACGCEDMAGNVWEWCENSWREGSDRRVVRGGSFVNNQGYAACACRYRNNPRFSINDHGFRCART
jgi:serine/threonine-protein kinase